MDENSPKTFQNYTTQCKQTQYGYRAVLVNQLVRTHSHHLFPKHVQSHLSPSCKDT